MHFKQSEALKTIKLCFSTIFWNLLWNKFWNHFQVEKIPWSPMFLDFLIVFRMVWKNQMSCESWLVGLEGIQKCQIFQLIISLHFWGVSNYFEISNFVFSDIFSWGGSVCKILTLYKAQKIVKFRFLPFQLIFLKFGLKTYGTLKVFLLSAQNNFHITLTSYLEEHKKKIQVWITCLWLVSRPPKCRCSFCKIYCGDSLETIFRLK